MEQFGQNIKRGSNLWSLGSNRLQLGNGNPNGLKDFSCVFFILFFWNAFIYRYCSKFLVVEWFTWWHHRRCVSKLTFLPNKSDQMRYLKMNGFNQNGLIYSSSQKIIAARHLWQPSWWKDISRMGQPSIAQSIPMASKYLIVLSSKKTNWKVLP